MKPTAVALVAAVAAVAACSRDHGHEAPAPAPAQAHEPPFHLTIGEGTVFEVGDAGEMAVFKLHASGAAEQLMTFRKKPPEWWPLGVIKADGSFDKGGSLADAYTKPHRDGTHMSIDGNTIAIDIPGLPAAKVELHDDKTVTLAGRPRDKAQRWRIDAADPAVVRTIFLVFGTSLKTAID